MKQKRESRGGSKGKWILARLVLLAGGCCAGILLVELGLRLGGFHFGASSAYQPDPFCGARHVPNYRGWHTTEGYALIEINRDGFRDHERTSTKPPGVRRVAVIGDSFAEAFQVDLSKTFCSVMERKLAESLDSTGSRVEVLNFGVSGYGTAQELEMLRHHVWEFDPDIVVLQFLASNDVADNSRELTNQTDRPFYTLEGDRLVLDDAFLDNPERLRFQTSNWIKLKHFVVEKSRIGALVYQLRHRPLAQQATQSSEPGLAMAAFRKTHGPAWERAWAVTDRLIVEIAREVRSHGAEFVVLLANSGIEVDPDDTVRQPVLKRLGTKDLLYPQRRIDALAASHQFTVIHTVEEMRKHCSQRQVFMHGFDNTSPGTGHWNENGHRVAGELAAAHLLKIGWGHTVSTDVSPQ